MKKILSIVLVCVLLLSSMSVLAFAEKTQYYRDGMYEFYIADGGAHIVNIRPTTTPISEVTIPLRLCWDADKKIDAPTNAGIGDDDNDAPDPFGTNYVYVTAVEEGALDNYTDILTKINIARFVEDIDMDSLRADTLQSITVDEDSPYFAAYNGTLYNKDKTKLLLHPVASSDNSILSTTTSFEPYAFRDCTLLTSIVLPAGVTGISERCFEGCTALKSIDFSAAKVGNIGSYAFLNAGLESVNLGQYIKLVNSFAFFGNSNLKTLTIPKEAKNVVLKAGAFLGCPIENFTVYRSIAEIGDRAIGYYYDDELQIQKYEDLAITSYKFNEDKTQTTPVYQYAKKQANDFKFIPLDDIYTVQYTYDQLNGTPAQMMLYKGETKKYSVDSSNGVFTADFVARDTYEVYFISKFGLLVRAGSVEIKTSDYQEEYSAEATKYEPIGDVTRDGKISVLDVAALLTDGIFATDNTDYDIDMDGTVGISDVSIVLASANYGKFAEALPDDFTTPPIHL
ncbi:MAG: leucine-rich repeat protein [Clostridia bacterium]|nr:leucine-rich repeat protein [Clostridia bacterium]